MSLSKDADSYVGIVGRDLPFLRGLSLTTPTLDQAGIVSTLIAGHGYVNGG
jgi:hypothetical protein